MRLISQSTYNNVIISLELGTVNKFPLESLLANPYQLIVNNNCKSSAKIKSQKYMTNTVGEILNEVRFPSSDYHCYRRMIHKNSFLDRRVYNLLNGYKCELFVADYIHQLYLEGSKIQNILDLPSRKIRECLWEYVKSIPLI